MVLAWPAKTSPVEPSSDIQSPSFSVIFLPPTVTLISLRCALTSMSPAPATHGRAHAAANHGRVAGHAAARRENALGDFHAVNVVRLGFGADQDHGSGGGLLHGFIGGENHAADRGAGRCRQSLGDGGQRFLRSRIEHRVQKLIELLRIDAQDGFFLADQALVHHVHRDADGGRAGALAIARLQHVEFACPEW